MKTVMFGLSYDTTQPLRLLAAGTTATDIEFSYRPVKTHTSRAKPYE